jgi:hypothetical protein
VPGLLSLRTQPSLVGFRRLAVHRQKLTNVVHLLTSAHATISITATSLSPRARHEPTKDVPTSLRELQLSPPLFQQTPRFQALDGKPIHLSLEKLTCCHALQREPSDGLVDQTILRYPSPRISAPLSGREGGSWDSDALTS